jgi:hypothetical protein
MSEADRNEIILPDLLQNNGNKTSGSLSLLAN